MPTIGGCVVQNARRVPHRDAVVAGERRWSWLEADESVAQVAGRLRAAGVGRGDRVALVSANTPEHILTSWAISRLAAVLVPVNARLAPPEVRHVLVDCGASLVAVGAPQAATVDTALAGVAPRPPVVGLGAGEHPDLFAADLDIEPVRESEAAEDDDAFIVYTSGTSGRPKGVLLDHHRAVWAAMAQVVTLGMRDGERYLHLPPLYHSGGVVYLNAMALLAGTNVLIPEFEPGLVLSVIEEQRITALLGVPTMFQFLLRHPDVGRRDSSSWRIAAFGAAPMPSSTIRALLEAFPTVQFFQQCGQTEAGPTGLYSTPEQVRAQPDSSGHQAQPFLEASVVDSSGFAVQPGQVGELLFRGETVMKGYWRDRAASDAVTLDGWLRTGDLVEVREDGVLKLVDRLKDVIITGGRNVYSAEVEQALAQHPDIVDCAVVGRGSHEWGSTVVAVITPRPGASVSLAEVREHCAPLIADYKIPREIVVGEVPRNAAGKIQKHLMGDLRARRPLTPPHAVRVAHLGRRLPRTASKREEHRMPGQTTTQGPLRGVRVLELGGIGPGPFAAMLLGDLGRTSSGSIPHKGSPP